MRYKRLFYVLLISITIGPFSLWGSASELDFLPYKKNLKEKILEGEIFSESKVKSLKSQTADSNAEIQDLAFTIAGLHPKSCEFALKKLSLYENYSLFLDFVKKSQYDVSKEEINFLLSHTFLPYDMQLIFKLPRITKEGVYPFRFDHGILKNLKGEITVKKIKQKCLFFTKADWQGPHTGFPNFVFEFFSQALSKLSMERLFRLSQTLSISKNH
jgi:hypothetical protein